MATGTIQKLQDTDTGWIDDTVITSKNYDGSIKLRKKGNVVELIGALKLLTALSTAAGATLGNLPSEYRPSKSQDGVYGDFLRTSMVGNPNYGFGMLSITVDGIIRFQKASTVSSWDTTHNIYFDVMYFVD